MNVVAMAEVEEAEALEERPRPRFANLAELLKSLGNVPSERVRFWPFPGTATEEDLIASDDGVGPLAELVDGTLVNKPMGIHESGFAARLIFFIGEFIKAARLGGQYFGADAMVRFRPALVFLPDFAYYIRGRVPEPQSPPISPVVPDLAGEVLSKSNRRGEIERKLREYFQAGVRLVWLVDPRKRTVTVCTSFEDRQVLTDRDVLGGGDVLPGLALPVAWIFDGEPEPAE